MYRHYKDEGPTLTRAAGKCGSGGGVRHGTFLEGHVVSSPAHRCSAEFTATAPNTILAGNAPPVPARQAKRPPNFRSPPPLYVSMFGNTLTARQGKLWAKFKLVGNPLGKHGGLVLNM